MLEILILTVMVINAGLTVGLTAAVLRRKAGSHGEEKSEPEEKKEQRELEREVENLMNYNGGTKL